MKGSLGIIVVLFSLLSVEGKSVSKKYFFCYPPPKKNFLNLTPSVPSEKTVFKIYRLTCFSWFYMELFCLILNMNNRTILKYLYVFLNDFLNIIHCGHIYKRINKMVVCIHIIPLSIFALWNYFDIRKLKVVS